jgi:hypothetical protein
MSRAVTRRTSLSESLGRLRLRLTAWYVATFFAVLALLSIGMFATITRRFDADLDESLRVATRELTRVARLRDTTRAGAASPLFDPRVYLRIPERDLYIAELGMSMASHSIPGCATWRTMRRVCTRRTRFIAPEANDSFARTPTRS